ncbi:hypothetical protein Pla22_31740 [Rubripirellula amarantea]|uniref:Ice-binding protein C-terminal domain-containing protein n=1 Tax=Rubripirellula amarantea TaxID=2527999 RepID=A0A5C5WK95_9BACT|nr:PEP-CTERM sorting domain-containing protein [Rubripirellula amarantea]TWT50431.1 hypothetical protein Pla22_31740 [Rubripirellula amarantea]
MKRFFMAMAAIAMLANTHASAALVISGVVDGTQSGGIPKAIELYATSAIADLSVYSIVRDTNGAGPFDSNVVLPSLALAAGDYFYVSGGGTSTTILNGFGFTVGLEDGIANVNGDDILGIAFAADTSLDDYSNIQDSFGVVAQGDTNFYENSFAIRTGSSPAANPAGVVDAGNFTITPYTDSDFSGPNGFGTFSAVSAVPEPSSYAVLGLIGVVGLVLRRRKQVA